MQFRQWQCVSVHQNLGNMCLRASMDRLEFAFFKTSVLLFPPPSKTRYVDFANFAFVILQLLLSGENVHWVRSISEDGRGWAWARIQASFWYGCSQASCCLQSITLKYLVLVSIDHDHPPAKQLLFHQGWWVCCQGPIDCEMLWSSGEVKDTLIHCDMWCYNGRLWIVICGVIIVRCSVITADFNAAWTQPSWTGSMGWPRTTRAGWSPSTRTKGAGWGRRMMAQGILQSSLH